MPRKLTLVYAAALATVTACGEPDSPAMDSSELSVSVDGSEMAARLTDRAWATRKVQQRAIVRMTDPMARQTLARQLVADASHESDLDALHRLLGSAMLADERSAVAAVGERLDDPAAGLEDRFNLARAIMRSEHRDTISGALQTLATDLADSPERYHYALSLYVRALYAPEATLPDIVAGLNDPDPERAQAAATALRSGPAPDFLPVIAGLAEHPEKALRKRAAQALAHHVDSDVGLALLDGILANETESVVCVRAIETLEHAEPRAAVDRLVALYDTPGCGADHRYVVLSSMRRALRAGGGDAQSDGFLMGLVETAEEPGLQGYAAAALGRVDVAQSLDSVAAYDALTQLTSRSLEDVNLRLAAIEALGESDATGAAQSLQGLLSDVEAEPEQTRRVFEVLVASGKAQRDMAMLADVWTGAGEDAGVAAAAAAFRSHALALSPEAPKLAEDKDIPHVH